MHESDTTARPRSNALTDIISEIWLRNLGPKGRATDANLVRIGVGAMRIFRMLDEIERELAVTIPIGTALKLGTAKAIAAAIKTGRWPSPSPRILLKNGQDRAPLYLVPGGVGLILELSSLASQLVHPGQIWGLHLPGFEGETPWIDSVPGMAAYLVDHLPDEPDVPISLIGYSFGGLVALEMARILHRSNRPVALLGIVDSPFAERQWPLANRVLHLVERMKARVRVLLFVSPQRRKEGLKKIMRLMVRRLIGFVSRNPAWSSYHEYVPAMDIRAKRSKELILKAHEDYAPLPIDFSVVLFKAKASVKLGLDPEQMWRPIASKLDVVEVEGTHTTAILPPLVCGLAAQISARLQATGSHVVTDTLRANAHTACLAEGILEPFAPRAEAVQAVSGHAVTGFIKSR